jgi:hypothetical protein
MILNLTVHAAEFFLKNLVAPPLASRGFESWLGSFKHGNKGKYFIIKDS